MAGAVIMGRHVRGQRASECGCIHINAVWVTPTPEHCPKHDCTLCAMRAAEHGAHVYIGWVIEPTLQDWATANPTVGRPPLFTPADDDDEVTVRLCYARHRMGPGISQETPHPVVQCGG